MGKPLKARLGETLLNISASWAVLPDGNQRPANEFLGYIVLVARE